jgi:hypothetical protein
MHYHIVVQDASGQRFEDTIFHSLAAAERAVPLVIQRLDDRVWQPNRYPGRSACRGEVAVYLDRGHPEARREVSIIRCRTSAPVVDPQCHFWGRHLV